MSSTSLISKHEAEQAWGDSGAEESDEEEKELVTPPTRKGLVKKGPAVKKPKAATGPPAKKQKTGPASAVKKPKATPAKGTGTGKGKGKGKAAAVVDSESDNDDDDDDDDDGSEEEDDEASETGSMASRSTSGSSKSGSSAGSKKRARPSSSSSSSAKKKKAAVAPVAAKKKKAARTGGKLPEKPAAKPKPKRVVKVEEGDSEGEGMEGWEDDGEYLTDIQLDRQYFLGCGAGAVAGLDDEATAATLLDGDGAEREAEDEEDVDVMGPPPGLASLPLTRPKLWREQVLSFLNPVELARLAHVCRHYKYIHQDNDVWFPWVVPIQEGSLLSRVRECRVLEHAQKTLMHVYMAATTHHCKFCSAWTCHISLLTLEPVCWRCFNNWCRTGVIVKSKAHDQYLLTAGEAAQLPSVTTPDNVTLFVRKHVQDFKSAQFEDGYEGLLAVKLERSQKAHERYQKALQEFAKKREAAAQEGSQPPKAPKKPAILTGANDIIVTDGGKYNDEKHRHFLLAQVGFRRKIHPLLPLFPGDLQHAWQYIMCRYCIDADPDMPEWKRPHFPSYAELYSQHHLRGCEYAKVEGKLL